MSGLAQLSRGGVFDRAREEYRTSAPVERVRDDLRTLDEVQRAQEVRASRLRRAQTFLWPTALILGLVAAFADAVEIAFVLAGLAVLLTPALWYAGLRQSVFEWRRIRLAQALVHDLAIDKGAQVDIRVDLGSPRAIRKRVGKDGGTWTFEDPWLDATIRLADGGSVSVRCRETTVESVQHDVRKVVTRWHSTHVDELAYAPPQGAALHTFHSPESLPLGSVRPLAMASDAGRFQIRLAYGGRWGADARASERGALNVPMLYYGILNAVAKGSGLSEPFPRRVPRPG